jgi:glutamyl-tRNA reductase
MTNEFKTKAQMNWDIGKEQEIEFMHWIEQHAFPDFVEETKQLFYQIRQNEYRRGKEDAKLEERKKCIEEIEKLTIECPIQNDKDCWCKPLEILKQRLTSEGNNEK